MNGREMSKNQDTETQEMIAKLRQESSFLSDGASIGDQDHIDWETWLLEIATKLEALQRFKDERTYVVGFNDGWAECERQNEDKPS